MSLISDITAWVQDGKRKWDMMWLFGFAGVGKTAVAQTIGEVAMDDSTLGAAFFFSRTRKQNDPSRVFISIAYQLAVRNEQYRHLVTSQLVTDLGLLQKDIRTQFKKLLIIPLSALKLEKKLLIIVDGLDECRGDDAQREIIRLISDAAKSSSLPAIWMICSRPEYHIKHTFSNPDLQIDCWRKELPVDDPESRRDIEIFVRAGFKEIMVAYPTVDAAEDGTWPAEDIVEKIVSAASGLFVYASTIIKFIGDETYADPDSQLQAVVAFIDDSPAKAITTNPLHYLDKLYEQILSDVQRNLLPLALQLLGTCALYPRLSVLQLANLYGLSQSKFNAALHRLHSVVDVPPPEKASQESLSFFHASFLDFLKSPARSGRFALNLNAIHASFAKACFGVLGVTKLRYAKTLAWAPKAWDIPAFTLAHDLLMYCTANVWSACINLGDAGDPALFDVIVNFRYPFLRFIEGKIPMSEFSDFTLWLLKQVCICRVWSWVRFVDVSSRLNYTT